MKGIRIAKNQNALLLEKISALVIGDLHIGMAFKFQEKGLHVKNVARKMALQILEICKKNRLKKVIFLGDVKDTVGYSPRLELHALKEFFTELTSLDVYIAKGNHDSHLPEILDALNISAYVANEILIEEFAFMHGNTLPSNEALQKRYLLIGHLHAAVKDALGYRKVFVFAKSFGKKSAKTKAKSMKKPEYRRGLALIALPAFNDLVLGSDVSRNVKKYVPALRLGIFDWENAKVFDSEGKLIGTVDELHENE